MATVVDVAAREAAIAAHPACGPRHAQLPGPADGPVLAAERWPSNADLIVDCVRLGYLRPHWLVLDPTFGRGVWWKRWQPAQLITHHRPSDGSDFRNLPYPDGHFDAACYDPPYVARGGRRAGTFTDMNERFGLVDAPGTPAALQELINAGLDEMIRVVRPGGNILVKCQDYVSSGRLWLGTHWTLSHALTQGLEVLDRFEHVGRARTQPPRTRRDGHPSRQQHARRNLSTLFVVRVPRRRR